MSIINPKNVDINTTKVVSFSAISMCVVAGIFYCYEYYLRVAPSVMTPQLMREFNVSNSSLGSLLAYYYFAYVPAQIPAGLILDRFGPRIVLAISCLICTIGTLFFAMDSLLLAKIGRFIVGFGSAFAYMGVLKIANIWLPKKYFGIVAGVTSALGMLGAISGSILAEKLVHAFGWRDTLNYAAFLGMLLTVIIFVFIKSTPLRHSNSQLKKVMKVGELFAELKKIMKIKAIWLAGIIGFFSFLPLTVFSELWAVPFLESYGLSSCDAAFGSSLVFLGFAFGGPIWGWVSEAVGKRKLVLSTGIGLSMFLSVLIVWFTLDSLFLLYIFLFSLGFFTSVECLVFVIGNDISDPKMIGTTVAFINMLTMCGGFILQPSVGIILDYLSVGSIAGYLDYQQALLIMPLGLLTGLVLTFFLSETFNSKEA